MTWHADQECFPGTTLDCPCHRAPSPCRRAPALFCCPPASLAPADFPPPSRSILCLQETRKALEAGPDPVLLSPSLVPADFPPPDWSTLCLQETRKALEAGTKAFKAAANYLHRAVSPSPSSGTLRVYSPSRLNRSVCTASLSVNLSHWLTCKSAL